MSLTKENLEQAARLIRENRELKDENHRLNQALGNAIVMLEDIQEKLKIMEQRFRK